MASVDPEALNRANLQRILLFLEDYDPLNASWENADEFLGHLRRTVRTSFKMINRPYLQRLYDAYRERNEDRDNA